ncbi:porin [Roseateles violae]|uniref:Porin n=1 Tax=Roseateles violae TaxID=3058042 RepID=A0ABT8DXY0_9BURK|nr:porin [Pelomonas sp. PFR6]MDN3922530.1 porin [Pelomonas sp. PFR6]
MKLSVLSGALLLIGATASAQTSVTMYGLIDIGVRHVNHATAGGDSLTTLGDGPMTGNRLGIRGTEDLGGGTKAMFVLEHGMAVDTGGIEQQGQMWGRQAWVGISGQWGTIAAGRLYGVMHRTVSNYDPLGIGNILETAAPVLIEGTRFDNSVTYGTKIGNVSLGAMYSLGEQTNSSQGRTVGAYFYRSSDTLEFGGAIQRSTDLTGRDARSFTVGGAYNVAPFKLFLGYIDGDRDAGFAAGSNLSGTPLANTNLQSAFNSLGASGVTGTLKANRNDRL